VGRSKVLHLTRKVRIKTAASWPPLEQVPWLNATQNRT
jgi:hypothetical protein